MADETKVEIPSYRHVNSSQLEVGMLLCHNFFEPYYVTKLNKNYFKCTPYNEGLTCKVTYARWDKSLKDDYYILEKEEDERKIKKEIKEAFNG